MKAPYCLLLALAAFSVQPVLAAEEMTAAEVVDLYRSYVGPEATLDDIQTLYYKGTIEFILPNEEDPAGEPRRRTGELVLRLMKPDRQRLDITFENTRTTQCIDGYDGWTRVVRQTGEGDPQVMVNALPPVEIRRLRALAWENLYFFREPEKNRVELSYCGTAEKQGKTTYCLQSLHGGRVELRHYIDPTTGRRVATSIPGDGGDLFIEGRFEADGLTFPEKQTLIVESQPSNIVTFEEIKVNAEMDASIFAFPDLRMGKVDQQ